MTTKLFISTADLKDQTSIEKNVEDIRLKQAILAAQNVHIQEILGSDWYDSLASKRTIEGTWTGLTEDETLLIENYLDFAIREYALYEYLIEGNFSVSNQGIEKQSSNNSVSADLEEIQHLYRRAKDRADFYRQRCITYICDNEDKFPLYNNSDQNLHPTRKNFNSNNIIGG